MAFSCRIGKGECIGCMECESENEVCCPNCSSECETLYLDHFNNVLGCERCVRVFDSSDVPSKHLCRAGRVKKC